MIENIEFIQMETPPFNPAMMDLEILCRELCAKVAPLLGACGIQVNYKSTLKSLSLAADAELIERMLLGMMSNSARSAMGGDITVKLSRKGDRAVIQVTDSGVLNEKCPITSVLEGHTRSPIPASGEGAGIGMPVVCRIVNLHGGTIVLDSSETQGMQTTIAMPIALGTTTLQAHAPRADCAVGRNPLLVALSNVLPSSSYNSEDLE